MIHPRIPAPVRPILETYATLVQHNCPDLIRAFYVVGSIALDGYDERFSDIDFVAVLDHIASPIDRDALKAIHAAIEKEFPGSKLSGSYVQWDDLGKFKSEVLPHPYYQDGKFQAAGYFEINSVTWWILRNHGIAVWGTEPAQLPFTVDWELLLGNMRENLNSYWMGWTKRPDAFLILLSDWGIQWAVLGVLRQYYTFRENSIVTKLDAAKYALNYLPGRWRPLIEEAIAIREGQKKRKYRLKILRMIDAVKLLKHVIQQSNEMVQESKAA